MSTRQLFITAIRRAHAHGGRRGTGERGQATAEYALILVAIAAMAGLLISFFTGGAGGLIEGLFNSVFSKITSFIPGIG